MNYKRIYLGIAACLLTGLIVVTALHFYHRTALQNTIRVADLKNIAVTDLDSVEYIELPSHIGNRAGFTATGISYGGNHCFYIGNYGKSERKDTELHPGIVKMNGEFSVLQEELSFDDNELGIQGIAYDETGHSLWYTNGGEIINCNAEDGTDIRRFTIGKYSKYKANGICLDVEDGSLWILCMYQYLLHYSRDGNLISAYDCEFIGQDHICMDRDGDLYISVGVDYRGEENYVICLDRNAEMKAIYRVKQSYAIEGIAIPDSRLYVVNDGIYHEAKIRKNYIQVYRIPSEGGQ